ncbi:unnamed protein product [Lampetra planeri]
MGDKAVERTGNVVTRRSGASARIPTPFIRSGKVARPSASPPGRSVVRDETLSTVRCLRQPGKARFGPGRTGRAAGIRSPVVGSRQFQDTWERIRRKHQALLEQPGASPCSTLLGTPALRRNASRELSAIWSRPHSTRDSESSESPPAGVAGTSTIGAFMAATNSLSGTAPGGLQPADPIKHAHSGLGNNRDRASALEWRNPLR